MTYIPEDTVNDIKNATNIVDVISESVLLKKRGNNYIGLCPFHSEKTPSFTVSPDKQIFYCFGCTTGGNVFSFLMKHEGMTFPEAARRLAANAGIEIPEKPLSPAQRKQASDREALFGINQMAMDVYHRVLLHPKRGRSAMAYLEDRGITKETIETFHLGYAPEGWENLTAYLAKKGVSRRSLGKCGLLIPKKAGSGYYDRFRQRIIFPILDLNQRVVGFGGRILGNDEPKYLNSPETPVYHKGRSLYGLPNAKRACRESDVVYIVEGYFDLISLYQNSIRNTVATLGTALTPDHIRILKGYASQHILVYDSDEAGVKAALRSMDIFMSEGVEAKVVVLPAGYDPDSFINEFGPQAFQDAGTKALGVIPFLVDSAIKKHGMSVEGKIRIIEEMKEPLSGIEDAIARSLHIKSLSEVLGIDESAILERIRVHAQSRQPGTQHQTLKHHNRGRSENSFAESAFDEGKGSNSTADRFEQQIIAMMLQFPEMLPEIEKRAIIDNFQEAMLKDVGQLILSLSAKVKHDVSKMIDLIDDKVKRNIIIRLSMGDSLWDSQGCLNLLKQYELRHARRKKELLDEIKAAEANKDFELLAKLLKDKQSQAGKHL